MDQEKFVINWMACMWISLPSLAQCLATCIAQILKDFLRRYHSICIILLHSISPYYQQVSAVLLVDGWVSLTQLQMMSDHGSQQEGGAYMYEREREKDELCRSISSYHTYFILGEKLLYDLPCLQPHRLLQQHKSIQHRLLKRLCIHVASVCVYACMHSSPENVAKHKLVHSKFQSLKK